MSILCAGCNKSSNPDTLYQKGDRLVDKIGRHLSDKELQEGLIEKSISVQVFCKSGCIRCFRHLAD